MIDVFVIQFALFKCSFESSNASTTRSTCRYFICCISEIWNVLPIIHNSQTQLKYRISITQSLLFKLHYYETLKFKLIWSHSKTSTKEYCYHLWLTPCSYTSLTTSKVVGMIHFSLTKAKNPISITII